MLTNLIEFKEKEKTMLSSFGYFLQNFVVNFYQQKRTITLGKYRTRAEQRAAVELQFQL